VRNKGTFTPRACEEDRRSFQGRVSEWVDS